MPNDRIATIDQRLGIGIRWLILLGLALLVAFEGGAPLELIGLFVLAGLWSLVLSVLEFFPKRPLAQALMCLLGDSLFALAFFFLSGTLQGPLVWAGLLPIVCAARAFRLVGGALAAVLVSLAFGLLALVDLPIIEMISLIAPPTGLFLLSGLVLGFAQQQITLRASQERDLELSRQVEAQRSERERIRALSEITATLGASLSVNQVLDLALDIATDALSDPSESASNLVAMVLLFGEEGLYVASARRLAFNDLQRVFAAEEGILKQVIASGEPQESEEPARDVELSRVSVLQNCASVYCTPLRQGVDMFGLVIFAHPEASYFHLVRKEQIEMIAQQVMLALQNSQLYEALNEEKERIVRIQEEARKQLARNLHDGPTQSIAAIAMRVNLARRLLERDATAAGDELFKVEELARRTTKEIRHMLFTLRPQALESSGIMAALQDLATQTQETFDQNVHLEVDPEAVAQMDLGRQGVLFYIAVEGLTNARKHAQAQNIWLRLRTAERDIVLLEIQDDGIGFDPREIQGDRLPQIQSGLDTLRERVELVNGLMRLESAERKGTRLRVWAPLTENASDRLRRGR